MQLPSLDVQYVQSKSAWTRQKFPTGAASNLGHFAPTELVLSDSFVAARHMPADGVDKQRHRTAGSAFDQLQPLALCPVH